MSLARAWAGNRISKDALQVGALKLLGKYQLPEHPRWKRLKNRFQTNMGSQPAEDCLDPEKSRRRRFYARAVRIWTSKRSQGGVLWIVFGREQRSAKENAGSYGRICHRIHPLARTRDRAWRTFFDVAHRPRKKGTSPQKEGRTGGWTLELQRKKRRRSMGSARDARPRLQRHEQKMTMGRCGALRNQRCLGEGESWGWQVLVEEPEGRGRKAPDTWGKNQRHSPWSPSSPPSSLGLFMITQLAALVSRARAEGTKEPCEPPGAEATQNAKKNRR